MLAIKNPAGKSAIFLLALAALLAGCTPPGPKAVLRGKELIEEGRYPEAVEELRTATSLLATNAEAWNYLGLACHRAGQVTNAALAYQKALALDHDLVEARYNLGCLWLEQNQLESAKENFVAYTLRRPNLPEGWQKLGEIQLRQHDTTAAERSFGESLRLNPQNAEALNGLGLIQFQRRRPREAAQYFASALKQQPDYGPALLNSAVVAQQYLNDPAGALQKYRAYLALQPTPADSESISVTVQALERQLSPPRRAAAPETTAQAAPPTPAPRPPASTSARPQVQNRTEAPEEERPPAPPPQTSAVEVVKLSPEPEIRSSDDTRPAPAPAPKPVPAAATAPVATESSPIVVGTVPPPKPGVLHRLNPANWFHRDEGSTTKPTPLSPATGAPSTSTTTTLAAATPHPVPPAPVFPRYKYLSPRKPSSGNRRKAESAFDHGAEAQQAGNLADAIQDYQQAVKADPSYFEAYYNLALAAYGSHSYGQALATWEYALALRHDSADALYNFALTLKAAGYPVDAATELEKLLAANSDETRAHLVLGNLYAEQLRRPDKAKAHYLKVLEQDPQNTQAAAIRYWLTENP
jgi:tetratricopeptide (TPR) repeat protein